MNKLTKGEFHAIINQAYKDLKGDKPELAKDETDVEAYAEEVGLSKSGARARLERLVEAGVLTRYFQKVGRTKRTVYKLSI